MKFYHEGDTTKALLKEITEMRGVFTNMADFFNFLVRSIKLDAKRKKRKSGWSGAEKEDRNLFGVGEVRNEEKIAGI